MLFDKPQQHLYDATGYYNSLIIKKQDHSIHILQWLKGGSYTIDIAVGLLTIFAFIGGKISG